MAFDRLLKSPLLPAVSVWLVTTAFGLVPPFSRDALNDHMVLPLLWEQNGLFWRDKVLAFTAYPPLGNLPYTLFAGFPWDWLASVVHAAGALLVLFFLNRTMVNLHATPKIRLVVLLSWSIAPAVVSLTTWCYVDLWLCAFATMAMERLTREEWHNRDSLIFGLFLGLALLVKYNALPLTFALMLGLLWRWGKTPVDAVRYAAFATTSLLIISGWWYLWNWIELGNPLYPLGAGAGNGKLSWLQLRVLAYHESPLWAAFSPIRQFFWGEINNPMLFDGMLHPLWLIGLFVPRLWKSDKRASALLIVALVYACFALTTGVRARYWLPGMVMLLPLAGLALMKLKNIAWKLLAASSFITPVIASVIFLSSLQPWVYWLDGRDAFLRLHVPDYSLQRWAASNLPEDATVYLLWTGGRAYYLDRPYAFDFGREGKTLSETIVHNTQLKQGYIIMQRNLAERTIGTDYRFEWEAFLANSCQLAAAGNFELWELKPCHNMNGE